MKSEIRKFRWSNVLMRLKAYQTNPNESCHNVKLFIRSGRGNTKNMLFIFQDNPTGICSCTDTIANAMSWQMMLPCLNCFALFCLTPLVWFPSAAPCERADCVYFYTGLGSVWTQLRGVCRFGMGGKKKPRLACTRAPDLNLIKVIFGMNCNANCKPDLIAQHQRLALLMLFVAEMEQKTLQPVSKNLVERHPSRAESVMAAD